MTSVAFEADALCAARFADLTPFQRAFVFGARGPTCAQAAAAVVQRTTRRDVADAQDYRIECTLMQFHIDQLFADLQRRFVHALGSGARRVALHSIRSPFDDVVLRNVARSLFRIWFRRLASDELAVLRGGVAARAVAWPIAVDVALQLLVWITLFAMCISPRSLAEFLLQRHAERLVQALQLAGALAVVFVNFDVSRVLVNVAMTLFIALFVTEMLLERPLVFLAAAAVRLIVLFWAAAVFWAASQRTFARSLHLYRFARQIAPREAEFVAKRNARVAEAAAVKATLQANKPKPQKSTVIGTSGVVASSPPAHKRRKNRDDAAVTVAVVGNNDDVDDDHPEDTPTVDASPINATSLADVLAPNELDLFAFADLTVDDQALLRDTLDFSSLYKDESHSLALFGDQLPAFDDPLAPLDQHE
jgi:hypothetical protein